MSNRTRQNNNEADRKMESDGSPKIPHRGETTGKPGLPSGITQKNNREDIEKRNLASEFPSWF